MKQFNSREFKKLLRNNGYDYVRSNGSHDIFSNGEFNIVVPIHLNMMIAKRLIKENNLIF